MRLATLRCRVGGTGTGDALRLPAAGHAHFSPLLLLLLPLMLLLLPLLLLPLLLLVLPVLLRPLLPLLLRPHSRPQHSVHCRVAVSAFFPR